MAQRWPSDGLRPGPAFSWAYPWGTRWRRRPDRHRQYCGGSTDPASTPPKEYCCIRWHQDRPVRDRPSRAGARLWFLRRPTGAANHVFGSWGKGPFIRGTAATLAQNLPGTAWRRLSAGEGTKGAARRSREDFARAWP